MVKLLMFWRPRDGDPETFERQWRGLLDRFSRHDNAASLVRIVNNRATPVELRPISDSGRIGWQGVTEFWFDNWEAARAALDELRGESLIATLEADYFAVDDQLIRDTGERPLSMKVMVLWRRRDDLTRRQAQDYWNVPHVRIGLEDLGLKHFLKRYFQNHVVALPWLDAQRLDGIAEFWVKDMASFGEMGSNAEVLAKVAEDETNFMGHSEMLILQEAEIYKRDQSQPPWTAMTA